MKSLAFVLAVMASGAAMAADGGAGATCAPHLSPLRARIYQKAVDGPAVLREFLFIRRGILQLDVTETADWAAAVTRARAACMKNVAHAEPTSPVIV
ncbi:MAG TPA: hypothetical protein VFF72_00885 [Caldimonas sp.]|nr:hypothetical protein [Caldimonas sp.]